MKTGSLPVLILSMHDESIYAERAMRAGANGYIMKQEATEKVLVAIRRILQGEVYLSDRLTNTMLQQYVRGAAPAACRARAQASTWTRRASRGSVPAVPQKASQAARSAA